MKNVNPVADASCEVIWHAGRGFGLGIEYTTSVYYGASCRENGDRKRKKKKKNITTTDISPCYSVVAFWVGARTAQRNPCVVPHERISLVYVCVCVYYRGGYILE
jgi:hypothetical protein